MAKAILSSPIGTILLDCDGGVLQAIRILGDAGLPDGYGAIVPGTPGAEAAHQLSAYFNKEIQSFDLPLAPAASARGQALRQAIVDVPIGETLSYGALARIAGSSARAIGQACSRNPFPIVVPCHRVLGTAGAIGHYSGGKGIITKAWLLDHERRGGLL